MPARLDWLTALVESDTVFAGRFGVRVEPGWLGFPCGVTEAVYRWELLLTSAEPDRAPAPE